MIVLAFDTSLAACSAAVVETGKNTTVLGASYSEPGTGHAEILLDMISAAMSAARTGFSDITQQTVTIGPGSFTGVRVALSAARGFRIAHNIPICGLTSLQAISANISKSSAPPAPVAVIIDARRQQAYGQVFDAALKPLCAPVLLGVDELGGWLEPWHDAPLTLMGTGARLLAANDRPLPQNWLRLDQHPFPDAAVFAQAFSHLQADKTPPDPLYLRQPDAKPQSIGPGSVDN